MIRNVIRIETRRSCSIFMRSNSSRPSFNPTSSFQHVNPPTPNWQLGGGMPRVSEWDIENTRRKTWDFSEQESLRDSYRLLTSAIIPRPIALVSSLSAEGIPNLAPFRPKDTRNNILSTKEFTVNIISEAFAEAANATSVESPANTDEWLISGLTKEKSTIVKPPFVRESAVSFECELYSSQDIGLPNVDNPTTTLILGLIRKARVHEVF